MKSRLIASIVVGSVVVLGTTGCNLIAPQATTIDYSASDGVNVPASGPLEVRNALIVVDEDGVDGNMIAAIVNSTAEEQTLRIEVGEGSSALRAQVQVAANSRLSLGDLANDVEPLRLEGVEAAPGSTIPVYFQSGDSEGALIQVPVLDGALGYLSTLAPTPSATPTIAPTPLVTPSPDETPAATETPAP